MEGVSNPGFQGVFSLTAQGPPCGQCTSLSPEELGRLIGGCRLLNGRTTLDSGLGIHPPLTTTLPGVQVAPMDPIFHPAKLCHLH